MRILAIDPGNEYSAYCVINEGLVPLSFGKVKNRELQEIIKEMTFQDDDRAAIEMIASYGMAVGREVFDTCRFIGRLEEQLSRRLFHHPELVYRRQEKLHICCDSRAKDANIRRSLIDRFAKHDLKNGKGTKANPDWFYGFSKDVWAAYAVAITYAETMMEVEPIG